VVSRPIHISGESYDEESRAIAGLRFTMDRSCLRPDEHHLPRQPPFHTIRPTMDRITQYRRVGILGGMGPAATIRLYEEITARTAAQTDQDHIPLIIESNPAIPDRTEALLGGGPDPLPAMLESLGRLTAAGADFIAIACNTAHAWYPQIAKAATVPVLHLIRVAAEACRARLPDGAAVGVLATTGTITTELYQTALAASGLQPALPSQADQTQIMRAIRLVKAGGAGNLHEARQVAAVQVQRLIDQGAKAILLGCTDLSVILRDGDLPVPVVDSTVALAEKIIALARGDAPLEGR
jgi:aspartate racemase